jgi:hypothetical protein
MQTAPGIPEAVARTDKSVPRQGHPYYRDNAATNQVTLRRVAPRPANPPLVPERQSFLRRNGPGGIRTLARTLTGSCAANYTTGPRIRAYFSCDKDSGLCPAFIEAEFCFGNRLRAGGRSSSLERGISTANLVTSNLAIHRDFSRSSSSRRPLNRLWVSFDL